MNGKLTPAGSLIRAASASTLLLLSGCVLGPDFHAPDSQLPATWEPEALRGQVTAQEITTQWWDRFNDPLLSQLVSKAGESNLDLKMAVERLDQSRAAFQDIAADKLPTIDAAADYSRARNSQKGLADNSGLNGKKNFNLWNAGIGTTWELDVWGRVRRAVEAADAQVTVAEADRRSVYITLMAETASDYIRLRGIQALLKVTRQNLATADRATALTRIRFEQGVATDLEVSQAAALRASIKARLPSLEQQELETLNALSLLVAEPPEVLANSLRQPKPVPTIQGGIGVGLPSELAQRRPDVWKAEAELHAATAAIGVATASFYPSITLSGSMGFQSRQLSDLGSWGSRQFSFGPALNVPIFEGGRLKAMLKLSEARQREKALAYQKVVLTAWHEVDDSISGLANERIRRNDLRESVAESQKAFTSANAQYKQGTVDYINVLSVQDMLLSNESALTNSDVAVSLAAVKLYRALGGGWPDL